MLPAQQRDIWERCFHPTGTFVEFERAAIEQSIQERFEQQVLAFPDNPAVWTDNEELTYSQLNQAANRIAWDVLERTDADDERVVVLLDQSPLAISGILGVLKAGKTFVLLDPSSPSARTDYMVDEVQPQVILTNSQHIVQAKKLSPSGCEVVNLDSMDESGPTENPDLAVSPDSMAYIAYTSGSTGQPKGVMVSHRSALQSVMEDTKILHICSADRFSLIFTSSGAAGLRDTFLAIFNGAAVCRYDVKADGINRLGDWLNRSGVTVFLTVPSIYRHLIATLDADTILKSIRVLHLSGEPVFAGDLESFGKHLPADCVFANVLGSTETPNCRWLFMDRNSRFTGPTVPIGYDLPEETTVLLLDENGRELGPGQVGQIAVKSRYLSSGYWQRPDLTSAVFRDALEGQGERILLTGDKGRLLPDGCLEHLGRDDSQFKVRGYRIEAAEIEAVLESSKGVKEAVVTTSDAILEGRRLVAYVVPSKLSSPTVTELRHLLSQILPEYMVPSVFVMLDEFPRLPIGKVNRLALPVPGRERPNLANEMVAPRNLVEQKLAMIWSEALQIDPIGVHDNFLSLGGDSLLATRVVTRAISSFKVEVPLKTVFESPTIADMALVMVKYQAQNVEADKVNQLLAELEAMSEEQVKQALEDAVQ